VSKADLRKAEKRLLKYALAFPEAWEDHPWGENVAKVAKKVFVFLGTPESDDMAMCAKLPDSGDFALTFPFTEPAGYGLGKAGGCWPGSARPTTFPSTCSRTGSTSRTERSHPRNW